MMVLGNTVCNSKILVKGGCKLALMKLRVCILAHPVETCDTPGKAFYNLSDRKLCLSMPSTYSLGSKPADICILGSKPKDSLTRYLHMS